MVLIPAIDLLDNECVRLFQGNYQQVKVYSTAPDEIARSFIDQGATRIHIVDLDAAKGKGETNRRTIETIRKAVACTLEVGGGIRSEADIEELLSIGIDNLVLGTILVKNLPLCKFWVEKYGERFVAGIDARDGRVRIQGWEDDSGLEDTSCALAAKSIGIKEIIYTNISKDGALSGPDIERTGLIAKIVEVPVILSGGIGSYEDIEKTVRTCHPLVTGIIIGKAIYEGKVSLKEAIRRLSKPA